MNQKRIVIKIGTSTLTKNKKLSSKCIKDLVKAVHELKKKGNEILIVTSGAIGLGQNELKIKDNN